MNIENHKYHHGNLRDEILTAAYNFVSENGYAAMSLRGIAENCNVSATAIYRPVSYTHLTLPTILRV